MSEREPILLPYQRGWVNDRAALKIWLAARQVGKSFALAMEAVTEAIRAPSLNMILSASERQSREVMLKVYQHLRALNALTGEALQAERENRSEVALKNGSRITSLPSSPATVRGFSGNVFLDEFAFHRDAEEIWKAMYPAVTRGHLVRVSSTPNGRQGMYYRLWSDEDAGFSRHRTDIYDAVKQGLQADMEALRRGIGDPDAWAQEYECRFVDEATAYITYEMIASCEAEDAVMDGEPSGDGDVYMGVDVGRRADLTVMWVVEKVGDVLWTRAMRVHRGMPFSAQRDALYALMDRAGVRRCCMDASGLGMQLAEEAAQRYGSRVEPVTFTAPVKEDLALTLRRRFEDRMVRIPADREVREDLHSVQKVTTAAGNLRFDAARTDALGHADRFWALALAVHSASTPAAPIEYNRVAARRHAGPVDDDGWPDREQERTGFAGIW